LINKINKNVKMQIRKYNKMTDESKLILTFTDRQAFRDWFGKYGTESDGVWLLFDKSRKPVTLSAGEALEEALCHGWIDGQMQSLDEHTYKKYFARRLPKSKWSAKNKELAQTLTEKGLMTRQGLEAIERAKENGAWDQAERGLIDDEQIAMFKAVIQPYEAAYTNLLAMSHSLQRTYTGFYLDAKSDKTRQARLEKIIDRLNRNLKPM
jgi:uncharacterized protein YdeI (YjbR/CyaY-like superfamily)